MKTALAAMIVLMACLLAADCFAQDSGRFQSVGGEYGRSVIGTFKTSDAAPSSDNSSNGTGNNQLWNWGTAPKGSLIKDGKLVDDPFNTWKALNLSNGWIGEVETDPFTGRSIYAYKIPSTGEIKYFYIDPYTGAAVYVDRGSSISNDAGNADSNYALPSIFR
ncbi:MAG: PepSY domain-containing protein [Methanothrix sp.]|nr:PepSY domain-containing protein [Methanothrix sp.]